MKTGVIKRNNELYIVKYEGKPSIDEVCLISNNYGPQDSKFLVQTKDGKYKVCKKKKSAWLKEQIKNAISK